MEINMPKVYLPTIMRRHTDGKATLVVSGDTVAKTLASLISSHPGLTSHLHDDEGKLRPYLNVFVNGDDIRALDGENTAVEDRDEVQLITAMAGGAY